MKLLFVNCSPRVVTAYNACSLTVRKRLAPDMRALDIEMNPAQIREISPDVVLLQADDEMPYRMLMHVIRYNDMKCTVIGIGSRTFETIQTAIRLGIFDYIVEDAIEAELDCTLRRVLQRHDLWKKSLREMKSDTLARQIMLLQHENFWEDAIRDARDTAILQSRDIQRAKYGLHFNGDYYCALMLYLSHIPATDSELVPDRDIISAAVDIAETVVRPYVCECLYYMQTKALFLLLNYDAGTDLKQLCKELLEQLTESGQSGLIHFGFTMGISTETDSLGEVKRLVAEARAAANNRFTSGINKLYQFESSTVADSDFNPDLFSEVREELRHALFHFDLEHMGKQIRSFLSGIMDGNQFVKAVGAVNDSMAETMNAILPGFVVTSRHRSLSENIPPMPEEYDTREDVIAASICWGRCCIQRIREKISTPAKLYIRAAEYFISNNYMHQISLNDTAAFIHLQPAYLSVKFKEYTGKNYSQYLTEFRLREAALLLQKTYLRVKEVSERVGFADAGYFGRVFRKYYGETPAAYRRRFLDST